MAKKMEFKTAKRDKVYIKAVITGPSGSGKSYSALRVATGIAEKIGAVGAGGSKIAYIGSEGTRNNYYADEFQYDLIDLEEFSIDTYMEAVNLAISSGYKVLIVDSLTHVWTWVNEQVNNEPRMTSFQAWGKWKPKHRKLMEKILFSPIHVVATARGKDEYIMEEKSGKQVPKKVGMGAQQDKDIQYEYTVAFMLDQDSHLAHAEKDNTHLFELNEVLTEKSGEKLYEWSIKGDAPAKQRKTTDEVEAEKLAETKDAIIKKCKELGGQKNKELMRVLKQYEPKGNPAKIVGLADANECLRALEAVEPLKEGKNE